MPVRALLVLVPLALFGVVLGVGWGIARSQGGASPNSEPAPEARAVSADKVAALEQVRIDEKLDQPVPLELEFTDETGETRVLGEFFEEGRPVVLSLGYYNCPNICNAVFAGLGEAIAHVDEWTPGDEYAVVTVSIDPEETPDLAARKKAAHVEEYGLGAGADGWHWLTADEESARALADAVGFNYVRDEVTGEYMHGAALFLLTPEGRTARYLYGVDYRDDFRLALVESSRGAIGTTMDKVTLYCFSYDADERTYVPVALNIMRLTAALTAALLAVGLGLLWLRESRRSRRPVPGGTPAEVTP